MSHSALILSLFLVSVAIGKATNMAATSVVELTGDTFEHDTQAATGGTSGDWFVAFYDPHCRHCQELMPIWEKLGSEYGKHHTTIAKVDCTIHSALCRRFKVTAYPTILLFRRGVQHQFTGEREVSTMTVFLERDHIEGGTSVLADPGFVVGLAEEIWDALKNIRREDIEEGYRQFPQLFYLTLVLMALTIGVGIFACYLEWSTPRKARVIPVDVTRQGKAGETKKKK